MAYVICGEEIFMSKLRKNLVNTLFGDGMQQRRTHQIVTLILRVSTALVLVVGTLCGQTQSVDSIKQ
jgi:hypothetical protein